MAARGGKPTYAELERQNRILRARDQEFEERYAAPSDVEGVGGRPAVVILRDKNFPSVNTLIDWLPDAPFWTPRHDPDGPPLGFLGAVEFIRVEVASVIDAMWVAEQHNEIQVRDKHRVMMLLQRPSADFLLRPDYVGSDRREMLKQAVEALGFGPSARQVFELSRETEVVPVEAERRGWSD
jgi:hypothetical protein